MSSLFMPADEVLDRLRERFAVERAELDEQRPRLTPENYAKPCPASGHERIDCTCAHVVWARYKSDERRHESAERELRRRQLAEWDRAIARSLRRGELS